MSRLFNEVAEMLRTKRMYIVDTEEGTFSEFTAEEFVVVSDILRSARFQPRLSLSSAMELCQKHDIENAGRS